MRRDQKGCLGILFCLSGIGLIVLILCIFFVFPPAPTVRITNASLTQFKLSEESLNYNLALDLAIKDTNKVFAIHYNSIELVAKYGKEGFAFMSSPPHFKQRYKNTTILHTVLQGQQLVRFSESELSRFNLETVAGVYSIDVVATMQIKKSVSARVYKLEWICRLMLPLSSDQAFSSFKAIKCINSI
ncbi:NDR1/HIN1-like protein 10 [Rosa rugosa]|uniref:NDR1/HIN1-like protein 10 n=1 Tax=Rosa rugosa TaxID=74645 RepID=UPI002B40DEB9|nr:NDR1/HIN1-like protein 10 [Rosa rugosa]